MHPHEPDADPHAMRCMEVRGGSHAVEETVRTPGLQAWVFSRPHEGADSGGDVHYLSTCGGGLFTRLLVADVSGHGASAADVSASLHGLMRRNINTKSQTGMVRALNRQFAELAQLRRFATAVVATYLANRRRLTVCNAGHPRPLWYHARDRRWSFLDEAEARAAAAESDGDGMANLPLGLDDTTNYRQFAVTLARGDLVLVYTDALIEAADPSGRMLGEEGLLALAGGLDLGAETGTGAETGQSLAAAPALLEAVSRHRAGQPADDDVTLLALTHDGTGPRRLSVGEKLDVYAKVFGLKAY